MMDNSKYKKYEPIFGSWYLSRMLGKGSFGEVYEITREEYGTTYKAALKVISLPQDEDDIKTRMTEGSDPDTISDYYEGVLKDIIKENEIMSMLKGNSNIVSYEDHQIIQHEDGIGYDVLIRMELLTPLVDRMMKRKLNEEEVIKLGIDICRALELCRKRNIIHRDIKPQNIFISADGDYKLGDFGIARTIEKTIGGMSKKGTYKYMAPEVFMGRDYDATVDIYSLGMVLYSLLNNNRGPFLPPAPAKITHDDEETARLKRFRGEPLPAPREAGPMLAHIIKKACAADPTERYKSASELKQDLEAYRGNYYQIADASGDAFVNEKTELDTDAYGVHSPYNRPMNKAGQSESVRHAIPPREVQKSKTLLPFFLIAFLILALGIGGLAIHLHNKAKTTDITNSAEMITEPEDNEKQEDRSEIAIESEPETETQTEVPTPREPENVNPIHAEASSTREPMGENSYSPNNVTDRDFRTAWVEGADGQGLEERIIVTFNNKYPIEAILIANGYQKSAEVYRENNRVKKVEIELDNAREYCTLQDYGNGEQLIILSEPHDCDSLMMTIMSVYTGEGVDGDDLDTCITEIRLGDPMRLDEYDVPVVKASPQVL